jgi:CBS domain-containing protein
MPTRNVPIAEAGPTVEDAMLRGPRTYPPETTVAEARAEFENPRVRLLLVARGDTYLGAVTRETIGDELGGEVTLGGLATAAAGALVAPEDPLDRAVELLDARQTDRLPVVGEDGTLVGLVCFNRRQGHFCVDA